MNKLAYYKEKIRQNNNTINNVYHNMSNHIFYDIMSKNIEKYKTFKNFLDDKDNVVIEYRNHNIYNEIYKDEREPKEEPSDFRIQLKLETFIQDVLVYEPETVITRIHGDLHIITGNDGDLKYWFICAECGTLILDDHADSYQYYRPSLLCPVCNKLKVNENGNIKYPFHFLKRDHEDWLGQAHWFSMLVRKQLMSEEELNSVINKIADVHKKKGIKRIWFNYTTKRFFKKRIAEPFVPFDYIAGSDMRNVQLKYLGER